MEALSGAGVQRFYAAGNARAAISLGRNTDDILSRSFPMALEKARELIGIQAKFSSGYNRNATRLILREVQNENERGTVDTLIREFDLERIFELKPGTDFSNVVWYQVFC
jgi:hypothetical protein